METGPNIEGNFKKKDDASELGEEFKDNSASEKYQKNEDKIDIENEEILELNLNQEKLALLKICKELRVNIEDVEFKNENIDLNSIYECESGAVDVNYLQTHIEIYSVNKDGEIKNLDIVGGKRWSRGNHDQIELDSTPIYRVLTGDEKAILVRTHEYGGDPYDKSSSIDDYLVEVFNVPDEDEIKKFFTELENEDKDRWEQAGLLKIQEVLKLKFFDTKEITIHDQNDLDMKHVYISSIDSTNAGYRTNIFAFYGINDSGVESILPEDYLPLEDNESEELILEDFDLSRFDALLVMNVYEDTFGPRNNYGPDETTLDLYPLGKKNREE